MAQKDTLGLKTDAALAELDPMQHLQNLDYPRRSGTQGESEAAAYIAQVLEQSGIEPTLQEFHYPKPKLLPKTIPPLVLLVWIILSLVNIQYLERNLIVSLIVLALPLALVLALLNFGRLMNYFTTRRIKKLNKIENEIEDGSLDLDQVITSRNVIAEIGPEDAEQEVLFTAHFDSISSKIPMQMMMIGMIVGLVGLLLYSTLYLVNASSGANFIETYFAAFVVFAAILAVSLGIFFASRSLRGNESHGIIDDGTGVAILLELATFAKNHPIPGHRFVFGFFGSEESGLIGSTHYYASREVDKHRLHVISVDMIGEKPPLAYVKGIALIRKARMDSAFNEEIASIAESFGIEIKGRNFPYPGSDFAPFMLDGGCTANWFINKSRLIHSRNDHLDNVNQELVSDALKLIVAYLLQRPAFEQQRS